MDFIFLDFVFPGFRGFSEITYDPMRSKTRRVLLKVSTMRTRMRLQQSASNSVGGGLPLCLFGIGLHPPVQTLNWHCHRTGRVRPISRQKSTRGQEISFSLEDSINFRDSRLCEISRARDERLEERPRISLALQMAELDRRREAIRKQRYNREFLNFVDGRRASAEEYSGRPYGSVMLAVMQDPSFQAEFDEVLQHRCCANAA